MSAGWVVAGLAGLVAFLVGLIGAATRGQDDAGAWRPSVWRWVLLAAAGVALLGVALRLAGAAETALRYPQ